MTVLVSPIEVAERLDTLGLTRRTLGEAVASGERERVSCTECDPLSLPGTVAWGHAVRHLRLALRPRWRMSNVKNLALTYEPELGVGVVVTSGSSQTGDPNGEPTTKHPKGLMSRAQVESNQRQLFGPDEPRFRVAPAHDELTVWFLLVYSAFHPRNDETGDHVARVELSMPAAMNERGWITRWDERIILDEIRLDDVPVRAPLPDDGNEPEVIVSRRSS